MNRHGVIAVSGCPRSGTSVDMEIQLFVHGEDMILGEKFPQESRRAKMLQTIEEEKESLDFPKQVYDYLIGKRIEHEELALEKPERQYRDMNPDGFWEMEFTCAGIRYRPHLKETLQEILDGKTKFVKIVSQGLLTSDPRFIGKILYMLRHPRAVAKSQERLVRRVDIQTASGKTVNMFENLIIHSPEMFIEVSVQAAKFFLDNPEIPVHFTNFEELIANPDEEIEKMGKFVGFGDYSKAKGVVKQSLNRSKHEDIESPFWEDAEYIYDQMRKGGALLNEYNVEEAHKHFQNIIDYVKNPSIRLNREHRRWSCYRAKRIVTEHDCKKCMNDPKTRTMFKKSSENMPGNVAKHWSEEPCLFECGFDLDRTESYLTLTESVKNNFWIEDEYEGEVPTEIISREERDRRDEICDICEFLVEGDKCSKCEGCSGKHRSRYAHVKCPVDKWGSN